MKHLKEKSYYIDYYDNFTINRCKKIKSDMIKIEESKDKEGERKIRSNAYEFYISYEKINSALNKEKTIIKRMDRDREIDDFMDSRKIPKVICDKCSILMNLDDIFFKDGFGKEKDRVVFKFLCKCDNKKLIYDNGEERIIKKDLCPDCNIELQSSRSEENKVLKIIKKCGNCGYNIIDEFDLKEDINPNFKEDRILYCISEEEAIKIQNGLDFFFDEVNSIFKGEDKKSVEKLEKERRYKPLEKINRMGLKELEKFLEPILKKENFTNFNFGKADIDKEIKAYYTVFDDTGKEDVYESNKVFRKLIKTSLKNTNWLLMDNGKLENKLGIIKGRLKGIDDNEELLKLLESNKR